MVFITEDLIRKKAEHNEGLIFSLEELSLHQCDVEKIEHIDKWCRDLKILYLQSNLIDKMENLGKLKQLEYINLALNNITRVENMEKCENLKKLDLTVNFIAEITSLESLRVNAMLEELYLVGNPCVKYEGYREYVVATLPQVQRLDGTDVTLTERLDAVQNYEVAKRNVVREQEKYFENERKKREGTGGRWYTDIGSETQSATIEEIKPEEEMTDQEIKEANQKYWHTPVENTPETRKEIHRKLEQEKIATEKKRQGTRTNEVPKRQTVLEREGKRLNLNQAKWPFRLDDTSDVNSIELEIGVPKYLTTTAIDVDVQPTYVKVVAEGRTFQMVLQAEICPDKSSCQRSQMTGSLLLKMPTSRQQITTKAKPSKESFREENTKFVEKTTFLEVNENVKPSADFANIVADNETKRNAQMPSTIRKKVEEKAVSAGFEDDDDVPPLM